MGLSKTFWLNSTELITRTLPDGPVLAFAPGALQGAARRYIDGFEGMVSFEIGSNPTDEVIENLAAAGLRGFSAASLSQIASARRLVPAAYLHCEIPLRSPRDIDTALQNRVDSVTIETAEDLSLLSGTLPAGTEVSLRLAIAGETAAASILARIAAHGFHPALSLSLSAAQLETEGAGPGLRAAAAMAAEAGVTLAHLHLLADLPSPDTPSQTAQLGDQLASLGVEAAQAFGTACPELNLIVGRGLVASSFRLVLRVDDVDARNGVMLGAEALDALTVHLEDGAAPQVDVMAPSGALREGERSELAVSAAHHGPARTLPLPAGIEEGDYLILHAAGCFGHLRPFWPDLRAHPPIATVLSLR